MCGTIILACPALRSFYYWRHYEYGGGYTWLVADGLAWGALLALAARGRCSSRKSMLQFGLGCVFASVLLVVALLPFGMASAGTYAVGVIRGSLINSFFAGVLAITLLIGTGRWQNLLHSQMLRFLGEISYGLYLIHMLVFDLVDRILMRLGFAGLMGEWRVRTHHGAVCGRIPVSTGNSLCFTLEVRRTFSAP